MKIASVLVKDELKVCMKVFDRLFDALKVREIICNDQPGHRIKELHVGPGFSRNFLTTENADYFLRQIEDYLVSNIQTGDEEKVTSAEIKEATYSFVPPVAECPLYFGVIQNSPEFWRRNMRDRIDIGFVSGFARARGARIGHLARIAIPAYTTSFRCAAELGVVMAKDAKNISEVRAMDYVFGYTCVNDMIGNCWKQFAFERNPQNQPMRFELLVNSYYGRNMHSFGPVGPHVVSKDEVSDPYNLLMYTKHSGEVKDRSFTNAMLIGIERCLSLLSQFMTLPAGSIIHMGAMGRDGITFNADEPLLDTDFIEIEIELVGYLRNYFIDHRFQNKEHR